MTQNPHDQIHFEAPSLEEVESLLPSYKFESFIAKGGMGAVYKATQISLDRPVAIKILPTEFGEDTAFRESFETEAKLMARLNHPNLIGIYDFGEIDGLLYIVMELVSGTSLYEKAYGKAVRQETAIDIIKQICEGLEHAHEVGILHRDIKPANILLKKQIPKIGDFGLARAVGNSESGGVIYGTPGYTAPEVLNSPDEVDQRADIYSVGIMLYELLTGKKPEGVYEPVHTHVECDPRLDKVIRKAINPNLRLRYGSSKEMAEELDGILRSLKEPSKTGVLKIAAPAPKPGVNLAMPGAVPARLQTSGQAVSPAAALVTPATGGVAARPANIAAPKVDVVGKSSMGRNMVIIIILLVAIYIAQDMLSKKKQKVEDLNAQNELEYLQKKKEREEAIAAQKAQYQSSEQVIRKPRSQATAVNPVEEKLSKLEALASLKDSLAGGRRPLEAMPEETFYLSSKSRMLLYVETPMTWQEADLWCREHGAYLATVRDSADAAAIADKIPSGELAWIGAGKSGKNSWSWSDGFAYSTELGLRKTSKPYYVGLSPDAILELLGGGEEHPFIMEWRTDGSEPGGLEGRLRTTRESLNQIDPVYPPGTYTIGSRNFCIIREPSTFADARELAKTAGGELFVPSEQLELSAVSMFAEQVLPENEMAWIGGRCDGDKWGWVTGEPWNFANWSEGYPADGVHLAMVGAKSAPWRDVSSGESLPYFLIEWSKDQAAPKAGGTVDSEGNTTASFADLREKAETLIAKENASREELHAENIKRLERDLDSYFNGLTKGDKALQAKPLAKIKAMYAGKTRLPDGIDNIGPSSRVKSITSYCYEKQKRIERDFLTSIQKIRIAYIAQLKKIKDELLEKGQITASRSVEDEISTASKSNGAFLSSFGIE